ncbi:MAG: hypothetical protein K6G03_10560 [Lachnospiraceae bacterium]|nr:hypothetical protein [Lachnospiraceae bacterium]
MNAKRILALTGVILIVCMYLATLILALIGNENTMNLFMLSVLMTIMVPLIIHLFMILLNVRHGKNIMDETYSYREKHEDPTQTQNDDQDLK